MTLSRQTIFNKAYIHLLTQASISENENSSAYHAPDGKKCPVGIFISSKEYSSKMEDMTVDELLKKKLLPKRLHSHIYLLLRLQMIHDYMPPDRWKYALELLAYTYSINIPVLP